MRRPLALLLLGAAALGSTAFAPADTAESMPIVCVRFRDSTVPGTTITVERPTDRMCVHIPNPSELPPGDA